jgi:hypothetical protein
MISSGELVDTANYQLPCAIAIVWSIYCYILTAAEGERRGHIVVI